MASLQLSLPPEIRDIIWDYAIEPRVVTLGTADYLDLSLGEPPAGSLAFAQVYRPPAVARVCRESRAVALQKGGAMRYVQQPSARALWAWFDPGRDTLMLPPLRELFAELSWAADLASVAEDVVIGTALDAAVSYAEATQVLFHPALFPNLRSLSFACQVQLYPPSVVPESVLFPFEGLARPLIVDLDVGLRRSPDIARRVAQRSPIILGMPRESVVRQSFRGGPSAWWGEAHNRSLMQWEPFQRSLKFRWLRYQARFTPLVIQSARSGDLAITDPAEPAHGSWNSSIDFTPHEGSTLAYIPQAWRSIVEQHAPLFKRVCLYDTIPDDWIRHPV